MKYLAGIGFPFLFQAAFTYIIVKAGTGRGSFVGLGALLFAVAGIPLTMIANFFAVRAKTAQGGYSKFSRLVLITLALPLAQLGLLVLVSVFRL